MDYICTPSCNVTFATEEITKMFDITITDNSDFEGLEQFSVNFTSPDYIIVGNPSEAVILIVDIDGECTRSSATSGLNVKCSTNLICLYIHGKMYICNTKSSLVSNVNAYLCKINYCVFFNVRYCT